MWPHAVPQRYAIEALALTLALAGQIELWARADARPAAVAVIAALVATVPLIARRRLPFAAPTVVFVGLAVISLARPSAVYGGASFTLFALMLAFWAAGAQRERHRAVTAAALGLAAVAVMIARGGHGGVVRTGDLELSLFIWTLIAIGLPLGAFALRGRAERAAGFQERADRIEREREERTRAAIAAERARIARDLHDVIAHSVTVMTVQGGAARLLLDTDPDRARTPLLVVEETGRQALADLRRLVGIVEHGEGREPVLALAPQPGLADLPSLVEKIRGAGLPTDLVVEGEPGPLAPGVELAAYRIAQEALTNTLKHAGPARARVTVRFEPEWLRLEITDDGRGRATVGHGGHGLVGIRERVALYGGTLEVGAREAGGFGVCARLLVARQAALAEHPGAGACTPAPPAT
jgi:signal transduction histidine kinase